MAEDDDVQDREGATLPAMAEAEGEGIAERAEPTAERPEAGPVDYDRLISDAVAPEGVTLDPELTRAGSELLARHGIPAEAAKDLAGFFARQQKAGAEGNARAFAEQVGAWRAQSEKRTTAEERGIAKDAALRLFGREELAVLDLFGVTNRAGFIKALAKAGKAMRDDAYVPGNAAVNGTRDARAHFPNSNMNP